jgi:hypothetical protein
MVKVTQKPCNFVFFGKDVKFLMHYTGLFFKNSFSFAVKHFSPFRQKNSGSD